MNLPAPRLAVLLALVPLAAGLCRADWTHYRGPQNDGTYSGGIRTNWTAEPPQELWRVPLDPALSSFTVSAGRLYTQARRLTTGGDREFAIALDAATGRELWAVDLDKADYPNGGVGTDDGPRSTPVVDGDRIYILTSYLRLYCLDAATGSPIWNRDFPMELGSTVANWQNAASPLIIGDLLFLNVNAGSERLMALRKSDGTEVWRAHDDAMTQSTPVPATLAGVPQVIFFTQSGLVSVRPGTGALLWRYAFPFSTSTAASPLVADDRVFCAAAYSIGSGAVRVVANGDGLTATEIWRRPSGNQIHWASPVYQENYVYAVVGNTSLSLRCVDLETGEVRWEAMDTFGSPDYVGYGSVLKVGGHLLVLSATGRMTLVELNPDAYTEVDHFDAIPRIGKCWNNAAIDDGILYVRSTLQAAAIDVRPAAGPLVPLRLTAVVAPVTSQIRIRIETTDGTPVDSQRASRVRLFGTSDIAGGSSWTDQGLAPIDDGTDLYFEVPFLPGDAARYFLVREDPG